MSDILLNVLYCTVYIIHTHFAVLYTSGIPIMFKDTFIIERSTINSTITSGPIKDHFMGFSLYNN